MDEFKQVTTKQFYSVIGKGDVVVDIVGGFPYTSIFKYRYGTAIIAKITPDGKHFVKKEQKNV